MCLTVWRRTIQIEDTTGIFKNLGTYLESEFLKYYTEPHGHGEWHAIHISQPSPEKMCGILDDKIKPEEEWWTTGFNDQKTLDKFFDVYIG